MARSFAEDLVLVGEDSEVAALLKRWPKRARAFVAILAEIRMELEGTGISQKLVMPESDFHTYSKAACAVIDAVDAYRRKIGFLPATFAKLSSGDGVTGGTDRSR